MVHGFMCPRSIPNPNPSNLVHNPSSVVKLLSRSNSGSNHVLQVPITLFTWFTYRRVHILVYKLLLSQC